MIIKLLIVDADAGSRDNYKVTFTRARHFDDKPEFLIVESVAAATAALQEAKEKGAPFKVVVADHDMPEGTGIDIARWIWARRYPARVVLITAKPEDEIRALHKDYKELRNNRVIFGCMDKVKSMAAAISDMISLAATTPANTLST